MLLPQLQQQYEQFPSFVQLNKVSDLPIKQQTILPATNRERREGWGIEDKTPDHQCD